MNIHTDHHFIIGQHHVGTGKPCQDHAVSGIIRPYKDGPARAYAVVSDGCSSAGQTDIGSRLITASTAKAIRTILPIDKSFQEFHPERIQELSTVFANSAVEFLGLDRMDMLATQLYAVVEQSGHCFVSVYGDGVVAYIYNDGSKSVYSFEWNHNMPYYPHEDRRRFIDGHGGCDSPSLLQTSYQIDPSGEITLEISNTFSAEAGTNGITFFTDVAQQNVALLALFTDGVKQVDQMPVLDVVHSLAGFKSLAGEFAKRRLIRFMKDIRDQEKRMIRSGITEKAPLGPIDDLGYAVIAIEPEDGNV